VYQDLTPIRHFCSQPSCPNQHKRHFIAGPLAASISEPNIKKTTMNKQILLILVSITLLSCLYTSRKDKNHFQAFVDQLKPVTTPLIFNSRAEYGFNSQQLTDSIFLKQIQKKHDGFILFGLLFKSNEFIAILGNLPTDIGSPFIITYDKNGEEVDSHLVYENVIGDMGIYIDNYVTIFPDFRIEYIDSTITRKINSEGSDEIPGTDSLTVKLKKYKINQSGKFVRTD
jgi:hypothetical protein